MVSTGGSVRVEEVSGTADQGWFGGREELFPWIVSHCLGGLCFTQRGEDDHVAVWPSQVSPKSFLFLVFFKPLLLSRWAFLIFYVLNCNYSKDNKTHS